MALKRTAVFASVIAMVAFAATAQSQNSGSSQASGQSNQGTQGSSTQAQSNSNANQSNSAQNSSSQSNQGSSTQASSNQGASTSNQGTAQTTDRNNTSSSNNAQTQPDRNAQSNSQSNANSDRNANTSNRSTSRSGTADQRDAVDGQYRGRNAADRANERNNDRDVDNRSDRDRADRNRGDRERSYINRDRSDRDRDSDRDRSDRDRSDRSNMNRDRDMGRDRDRGDKRGPDIGLWFNRGSRDGLVISDVSSKGPIAKFGFREGDRIVSVDGHRVSDEGEFMRYVLHSDRDRVSVVVFRDGREQTIYVEPAVLTEDTESAQVDPLERFGIILDDRYDDRIVVWRVIPRSPAYYAGFRPGDVIVNFGDHPYRTRNEFEHSVTGWKAGDVNVQIRRGENTRRLSADVPNDLNRSDRVAERTDRRADRADRRADRMDDRNYNNQQNRGRIGSGILNRGR